MKISQVQRQSLCIHQISYLYGISGSFFLIILIFWILELIASREVVPDSPPRNTCSCDQVISLLLPTNRIVYELLAIKSISLPYSSLSPSILLRFCIFKYRSSKVLLQELKQENQSLKEQQRNHTQILEEAHKTIRELQKYIEDHPIRYLNT